ncbi:MAG: 2TM domain-containing protein [Flavobacterium sp.]|nr:2TM domain-containing protein [Flavobacterium sp.]
MDQQFINEQKYERAKKRVRALSGFYKHLAAYVIVNAILLLIKYYDLGAGESMLTFSNFSTVIFWGIGLFFHGVGIFGSKLVFGNQWEERKIAEIMDNEIKRKYN